MLRSSHGPARWTLCCLLCILCNLCTAPLAMAGQRSTSGAQAAASYQRAAAIHIQAGDLERAAKTLAEALERAEPSPELYYMRADVERRLGRPVAAAEAAEKALELDATFVPAHVLLGDIFRDQGWLQAATDCYREALAVDPQAPAARYRLVQCLAQAGRLRVAERECREFLAEQETAQLVLSLGTVLEQLEEVQAALAAYDRALVLEPNLADAHSRRAGLLCRLDQYDEAAKAARRALSIDPEHAEAHGWLGLASAHREDYLGAYGHAVKAEQAGLDMSAVWSILQGRD
jgi:tetratricopeptide (TPR) repeat protein